MVRPPQAPAYIFFIDFVFLKIFFLHRKKKYIVSNFCYTNKRTKDLQKKILILSGMLRCALQAITESLDKLPGSPRTQVGFITFDSSIHFYNLKPQLNQPQMLVVSEISDVFLPAPDDLLVNLKDSRKQIDLLLQQLPSMFEGSREVETVMGTALQSAFQVMHHIGIFSLPSLGLGKLKHRDNPRSCMFYYFFSQKNRIYFSYEILYLTNLSFFFE
eukprot:GSMAST32.ASY1.ANO1.2368.1 assembled CDS